MRPFILLLALTPVPVVAAPTTYLAGSASVDITPSHPVRLSGYGNRREEATGVEQRITAQALAIADKPGNVHLLIAVESCGVSTAITEEVAKRLEKRFALPRARFALTSTHTHSAPMLSGVLATLFSVPIPEDHKRNIDRYTRTLTDQLEKVGAEALGSLSPARLLFGIGEATFAGNRRTKGGPVDHDLPFLRVEGLDGKLRAIALGYACHCTALGGGFNRVCGDWAGYAREMIETRHAGTTALITIGCGADADPYPRTGLEHAKRHGAEIATEVDRLLASILEPLEGAITSSFRRIRLAFDKHPSREEWEKRATQPGAVGFHAKTQLARLDRGESLQTELDYPIQTWIFGDDLAMVFLAGEVVVDYSVRLERELDRARLWVTAYANDVPCYIPSRRIHAEGGYEGGAAMIYYDRPTRLVPGVEDRIVDTVHALVPKEFRSQETRAEFPPPLSPEESLRSIHTRSGLRVELVAHEPLVIDPVAIDFGVDGRVWVLEMRDYPTGLDGNGERGGRVKVLEDSDGDGRHDRGTVFLDDLPFPTGIMEWRDGVLICAAPDILYAEDTDDDGRADVIRKLFSGFATHNYQARINGLSWGLDHRVYAAAGLFGAKVKCHVGGEVVGLHRSDLSFDPDRGTLAPAAGLSQQGRPRDDFGNWFGNENWFLLRHYPLDDRYVRRNPHVASPNPRVDLPTGDDSHRLHPRSRTLRRFNDPGHANRTTSACGPGIYRDRLLGDAYHGDAFVCEPVHNLVHRLELERSGVTFRARRAPGEESSEFLASTDSWFRPAQVTTGPDGGLWIVDMYRFVIEHPRWISKERLELLDVRAGADRGRIYRVVPANGKARPIENLARLDDEALAKRLDTPNGAVRDLVHRELVHRAPGPAVRDELHALLVRSDDPAVRLQTLCVLDGVGLLDAGHVRRGLLDGDPRVRAHAVRLSERLSPAPGSLLFGSDASKGAPDMARDDDPLVRFQLALTLGELHGEPFGQALAKIAERSAGDPWLRAAVLSSTATHGVTLLARQLAMLSPTDDVGGLIPDVVATVAATAPQEDLPLLAKALRRTASPRARFVILESLLASLERRGVGFTKLEPRGEGALRRYPSDLEAVLSDARKAAIDDARRVDTRLAAVRLLGRASATTATPSKTLTGLIAAKQPVAIRKAAIEGLARSRSREAGETLVEALLELTPASRDVALDAIVSREAWTSALLDAVGRDEIPLPALSAAHRERLLRHESAELRKRAERVLVDVRPVARKKALASFRPAIELAGDDRRGAAVFMRLCATCHEFRGRGESVGASLAALQDRTPAALLVAIVDPNAAVESKFESYDVVTRDGRVRSGLLKNETATALTLVAPSGEEERLLRADVVRLRSSGRSMMPEGLETSMTRQELADLMAFLRGEPDSPSDPDPATGSR